MDASCMVRTGEVLTKEHPVTVRAGEVLVVTFVTRHRRRGDGRTYYWGRVHFRPHRYDALQFEWVDVEARESVGYRGYSLMVEMPLVNERCQLLTGSP